MVEGARPKRGELRLPIRFENFHSPNPAERTQASAGARSTCRGSSLRVDVVRDRRSELSYAAEARAVRYIRTSATRATTVYLPGAVRRLVEGSEYVERQCEIGRTATTLRMSRCCLGRPRYLFSAALARCASLGERDASWSSPTMTGPSGSPTTSEITSSGVKPGVRFRQCRPELCVMAEGRATLTRCTMRIPGARLHLASCRLG